MRLKIVPMLIVAAFLTLLIPTASADVCIGPCGVGGGTGGGGGGGTGPSGPHGPFFNISNAVDGGRGCSGCAPSTRGNAGAGIVTEGDNCLFTVTRTGKAKHAASVHYYTTDGTAQSGIDYDGIQPSGDTPSANFEPGQKSTTVTIGTSRYPEEGEAKGESPSTVETFTVHLIDPQGAKIKDGKGTCSIGEGPGDFQS